LVDAGQSRSVNIVVADNLILSNASFGIAFLGAKDCTVRNNSIVMMKPEFESLATQSGIIAAIFGAALIENNTVINATDYGISFGGYGLGSGSNLTIIGNYLLSFGKIGIWDDGQKQGGAVLIQDNTIWDQSNPFNSIYGIKTDYINNKFSIIRNRIFAGAILAVSAPNSIVLNNDYKL
jgi:parallel beta-helix repeat protein